MKLKRRGYGAMKKWKACCLSLAATTGLTSGLWAQVPAVPVTPDPATAATAAQPRTLWSFLGLTKEQKEEMRRKCCKTPMGQMLGQMFAPVRAFSGGVFGNLCPQTPTAQDLAKPGA